jgi:hypothetical protein
MSLGVFFAAILLLLVVFVLISLSYRAGFHAGRRQTFVQNYQMFPQVRPIDYPIPEFSAPVIASSSADEDRSYINQSFMRQLADTGHAVIKFSRRNPQ